MFYIVVNKTTGEWLTHSPQKNKTAARLSTKKPPRLFTTKNAAEQALQWWAGGEFFMRFSNASQFGPAKRFLDKKEKKERCKEEMEVVPITLLVQSTKEPQRDPQTSTQYTRNYTR